MNPIRTRTQTVSNLGPSQSLPETSSKRPSNHASSSKHEGDHDHGNLLLVSSPLAISLNPTNFLIERSTKPLLPQKSCDLWFWQPKKRLFSPQNHLVPPSSFPPIPPTLSHLLDRSIGAEDSVIDQCPAVAFVHLQGDAIQRLHRDHVAQLAVRAVPGLLHANRSPKHRLLERRN